MNADHKHRTIESVCFDLELRMKYAQIDFSNTGRDGLRLKPT